MTDNLWTKGPWSATNHFADETTPCNCAYVLSEGYAGSICGISFSNGLNISDGGNDCPPMAEAIANAHLIASAPSLYDALKGIFDRMDKPSDAPGHMHRTPGIWDEDASNGERGGQSCDWCAHWESARAALASARGDPA